LGVDRVVSVWTALPCSGQTLSALSQWVDDLSFGAICGRISPPPSAIVERTPDGEMLLLATDETFAAENSIHVAVADEIQLALQPLQDEDERWLREDSRRGFGQRRAGL
jgi:hypothetical protein